MHALDVINLKKTYGTRVEALKGISLTVEEGDFFALLGPNGAGKSTLIGIAASLVRPSSGDVKVFGKSVVSERSAAVSHIGLVPQEFNFNQFEKPFEILVNQAGYYGVPRDLAKNRAEQYLKQLSLWDKKDVASRTLRTPAGESFAFPLDSFSRTCLLEGVDELGYLLARRGEIQRHESAHHKELTHAR